MCVILDFEGAHLLFFLHLHLHLLQQIVVLFVYWPTHQRTIYEYNSQKTKISGLRRIKAINDRSLWQCRRLLA